MRMLEVLQAHGTQAGDSVLEAWLPVMGSAEKTWLASQTGLSRSMALVLAADRDSRVRAALIASGNATGRALIGILEQDDSAVVRCAAAGGALNPTWVKRLAGDARVSVRWALLDNAYGNGLSRQPQLLMDMLEAGAGDGNREQRAYTARWLICALDTPVREQIGADRLVSTLAAYQKSLGRAVAVSELLRAWPEWDALWSLAAADGWDRDERMLISGSVDSLLAYGTLSRDEQTEERVQAIRKWWTQDAQAQAELPNLLGEGEDDEDNQDDALMRMDLAQALASLDTATWGQVTEWLQNLEELDEDALLGPVYERLRQGSDDEAEYCTGLDDLVRYTGHMVETRSSYALALAQRFLVDSEVSSWDCYRLAETMLGSQDPQVCQEGARLAIERGGSSGVDTVISSRWAREHPQLVPVVAILDAVEHPCWAWLLKACAPLAGEHGASVWTTLTGLSGGWVGTVGELADAVGETLADAGTPVART